MKPLLQDYRYYDIFSIVFKITDKCNLGCTYCYRENAPAVNSTSLHMPLEVIAKTLNSVFDYKQWLYSLTNQNRQPTINFVWHGGEPLLVGPKRMKKILGIQERFIRKGLSIQNSVQTNGTPISDSILNIFKDANFRVGISIDGPKKIHDVHRKARNNNSSFEKTYNGIQMLRKAGIPWSAISVLTEDVVDYVDDIYAFFKNEQPTEVDFIPSFFYDSKFTLHPKKYAEAMIHFFDLWVNEKEFPFTIRFFKDVLYLLGWWQSSKNVIICELSGRCHRNISILTNGDFYTCECLNSKPTNKVGNILKQSILDITFSDPFFKITTNTNMYHEKCLMCDVFDICKAGCYNRRLTLTDGFPQIDFYCDARKRIIHHINDWAVMHKPLKQIWIKRKTTDNEYRI